MKVLAAILKIPQQYYIAIVKRITSPPGQSISLNTLGLSRMVNLLARAPSRVVLKRHGLFLKS